MRLLAARMLFVLTCLTVPQFMEGGRIFFRPAVNLWKWGTEAVQGHGGLNFSISNPDFLGNVLTLLLIPALFAGWFALMDMLRQDTAGIQKRSKYVLPFLLALSSWVCMVVAIAYSINHQGPLFAPYRLFSDLTPTIYGTAFALLLIEYLTYFISFAKK